MFIDEFYKTLKGEIITILYNFFQKVEAERILSNLLCEASITQIPKQDKIITRKENYRPIALINIYVKILSKILANQFQQRTKIIILYNQVKFILGMQGWFSIQRSINVIHHINRLKNKKKIHDRINRNS